MSSTLWIGASHMLAGLKLVTRPALRGFVLWPLVINTLVFVGLIYGLLHQFDRMMAFLMPTLPTWLQWMDYLLWPLLTVLLLLMVFFSFTLVAGFFAAPFNGLLSEKVEQLVRGHSEPAPFCWRDLLALVPRTLQREGQKLGYFIPRALGLLALSFIPLVNAVAAPLWLIWGIWMVALQYLDYPADNHQLTWAETLAWFRQRRGSVLGFGSAAYALLLVPGLNILVMPAAVAGATLLWVQQERCS